MSYSVVNWNRVKSENGIIFLFSDLTEKKFEKTQSIGT